MPNVSDAALRAMAEQLIHEQLWDKKHNAWVTIPTAEKLITNALRTIREAQRERDAGVADVLAQEALVAETPCANARYDQGKLIAAAIRQPEGR